MKRVSVKTYARTWKPAFNVGLWTKSWRGIILHVGFVQVMENVESHGILEFNLPGLESHGKWKLCLVDECNLLQIMTKQGQLKIKRSNWTARTTRILVNNKVCVCWTVYGKKKNMLRQWKVWKFSVGNWQLSPRSWKTWKGHENYHGKPWNLKTSTKEYESNLVTTTTTNLFLS